MELKFMHKFMRTTLDLPEDLLLKVVEITKAKSKTRAIVLALESVVRQQKLLELKKFRGKVDLDVDLNVLRKRK